MNSPNVSMQSQDTLDEEPSDTCTLHTAEEGSAELKRLWKERCSHPNRARN